MNKENIKKRALKVMADIGYLSEENIKGTDKLRDDLGFDSLGAVMLVVELEKEFDISIPDEDVFMADGSNVDELVDYLCKKIEK